MTYKFLKWTRVVVALVFFLLVSLVFLDFRNLIGSSGVQSIIFLQFVPSFLKFLTILSLSAIGFLIILILTVLFGRVYCSAICPLGILQDFISRAGKLIKKRKKYKFSKPHNILRNSILILTIFTGIFFSIFIINLLDPYSGYGKIASQLFRPAGIWINNGFARLLESLNVYFLHRKDIHPVNFSSLLISFMLLGIIILMAGKWGRLYCNTICPVGTLLGWISKISLFKIQLNKTSCTQCGQCMFSCKSQCISVKSMEIDHSRCVACFNCLTVCKDNAIHFSLKGNAGPALKEVKIQTGRKNFLLVTFAGITSLAGMRSLKASISKDNEPLNKTPTTIPEEKNFPVSPPGSLSLDHFTSGCTACQLCVSQCPTGVLQPSFDQYGFSGIMQPHMDYNTNYCNFECIKCAEICPTGAILSITKEEKKTLQIGKVQFVKENCVVYTENTACGSCSEHCPTQAVKMVPYKGTLTIPETDNSICVGCGACEYACPVIPYKAIYVDGNPIHEKADEPKQEKLEDAELEEFPF